MFCEKCGAKLEENEKFCPMCGTKVKAAQTTSEVMGAEEVKEPKEELKKAPKKPKKGLIAAIVAVVVIIAGVIGYSTVGMAMSKNKLAEKIDEQNISYLIEEKNEELLRWNNLGSMNIQAKREIISTLKQYEEDGTAYLNGEDTIKKMKKEGEAYDLDEAAYTDFCMFLADWENAYAEEDVETAVVCASDAESQMSELVSRSDEYINMKIEFYENLDLSKADATVQESCASGLKQMKKLKKSKDTSKYLDFKDVVKKMDEDTYLFIEPENALKFYVQQIDVTDYPKVRLYLNIMDEISGEVPKDLENNFFYLNREDANGEYVKQVVTSANQLNDKEALKVNMVADVSGSMSGAPLNDAKQVMSGFVNSLQFDAGDMVELTSFATGVVLEEEVTDDKNLLLNKINGLATGDMTSLYDALYTAVGRIASQPGARCVMAFTDGQDNYSNCSPDNVIDIAKRYHVPVFIIGIGSENYSEAQRVAEITGGKYYNISEIVSMEDIYNEIYRMEKELYMVEYEDASGASANDIANICVGYRSPKYGGECTYSYAPNVLMSVNAKGFYKDGPEACVEGYIKNFMHAMTNRDIHYVDSYLLAGSAIYQEQEKYVKQGIDEQLDSYEIVSTDYSDSNNCVVTTRETIYVQIPGKPLQLMTQECKYQVTYTGGEWKMTAFADKVNVLNRINQ